LPGALDGLLSRVVSFLEKESIVYMVIGGFALPAYGEVRTTLDLDVAVSIGGPSEFDSFVEGAEKSGFKPTLASFSDPVSVFRDSKSGLEVEFWVRPDVIKWDSETVKRRRKTKIGSTQAWLVSPEDFIVTKLSRPDRGVQDEKDVKGVLVRLGASIDRKYVERRARSAGVLALLEPIDETG
jgi:hypothetical protein